MYVCMYVRMYVCTYVRMYVCTYVRMYICTYVHMYVCTYVRMYVCTYVRMYVCCMYVYILRCVYTIYNIHICVYIYVCICMYILHLCIWLYMYMMYNWCVYTTPIYIYTLKPWLKRKSPRFNRNSHLPCSSGRDRRILAGCFGALRCPKIVAARRIRNESWRNCSANPMDPEKQVNLNVLVAHVSWCFLEDMSKKIRHKRQKTNKNGDIGWYHGMQPTPEIACRS